jgi:hypothetical protein
MNRKRRVNQRGLFACVFALAGTSTACGSGANGVLVPCTSRVECGRGEICDDGRCVPGNPISEMEDPPDSGPIRVMRNDAGTREPKPDDDAGSTTADAGMMSPIDTGVVVDSGTPGAPDAGPVLPIDAGNVAPDAGCPNAVQIRGGGAYCTITEAITAASPGAAIDIPGGVWAEAIDVSKALELHGTGSAAVPTVISGPGNVAAVRARATPVLLDNLTIEANGAVGLDTSGAIAVTNLTIAGAAGAGIRVAPNTTATFAAVVVRGVLRDSANQGHGLDIGPGATVTFAAGEILDATYLGVWAYGATVTIQSSRILRSGRTGCSANWQECADGVLAQAGANLTIEQGSEIEASGGAGVSVISSSLTIRDSTASKNGIRNDVIVDGVFVESPTGVIIENNAIDDNLGYGVGCWNGARINTCRNNTHTNNDQGWTNCQDC